MYPKVFDKTAGIGQSVRDFANAAGRGAGAFAHDLRRFLSVESNGELLKNMGTLTKDMSIGAFALTSAGLGMKAVINKIQNDTRRSAIIQDLIETDPVLKEADPDQVMEYYAMIYRVAPRLSLEKLAVKELLQNFIKFGRVDIQSIKMIAETEHKLSPETFNLRDMLV